jgi:methylmalonyl-CoA mutase N-terminal domain/subunit
VLRKEQIERLQKLRRERDNRKVKEVLEKLHYAAEKDENLMPTIIEAVKAYAPLGEITDVSAKSLRRIQRTNSNLKWI